ncbi:hypothetical protein [Geobacillus jurassicus]|uniref:Uncharacterized protein n=1 Tax=Geobacillus jurassicus TaxID=235932 RepID=A0ABV6GTQ2_9BACL|nr:hypothetical protein [Geobacillus jurassicus]
MNRLRLNVAGYSLVTTMLVITIFFLLGLTTLTVAIQQARLTTVRVENVESFHEAKTALNEASAELKAELSDEQFLVSHGIFTPSQWDAFLGINEDAPGPDTMAGKLKARYGVNMEDVSYRLYNIPTNSVFLRALDLSKPFTDGHHERTVKRRIFLTNAPSFLKYALGSKETLVLNGGVYVEQGNVYAGRSAYISNAANYVKKGGELTVGPIDAGLPASTNDSIWHIHDKLLFSCTQTSSCWKAGNGAFQMEDGLFDEGWPANAVRPLIQQETDDFIDIDFDRTLKDKLLQAAGLSPLSPETQQSYIERIENDRQPPLDLARELYQEGKLARVETNAETPYEQSINQMPKDKPLWLDAEGEEITLYRDIDVQQNGQNQWLIVNGDLHIEGPMKSTATVRGNLIVFGDLMLTGNLALNASIYVTGKTAIYNSHIDGTDGKGLVLLSKGTLDIARINEFQNPSESPNLKGYFYTDSSATIYAVGSYLYIEGGLFARGNGTLAPDADRSGLVINAFRGRIEPKDGEPGNFIPSSDMQKSRLIIKYNPRVLVEQGTGLPFVNRISLVADRLEVK